MKKKLKLSLFWKSALIITFCIVLALVIGLVFKNDIIVAPTLESPYKSIFDLIFNNFFGGESLNIFIIVSNLFSVLMILLLLWLIFYLAIFLINLFWELATRRII